MRKKEHDIQTNTNIRIVGIICKRRAMYWMKDRMGSCVEHYAVEGYVNPPSW
jgi:hypothetical protein